MTRQDVIALLQILKFAYPNYYRDLTPQTTSGMINLWEIQFRAYDKKIVEGALNNYIKVNKYPPTIAGIFEEMNKLADTGDEIQVLWDKVARLCSRASAVTQEKFDGLPQEIKSWLGSIENLRGYGKIDEATFKTVTRGQFFKEMPKIVEHSEAKERVKQLGQSVKQIGDGR